MRQRGFDTDTIQITPEILSLVAEIDEFKGAWRAFATLAPERLSVAGIGPDEERFMEAIQRVTPALARAA